jgi:hypothetical protein
MNPATQLTKFGIWFHGPQTPELFDACKPAHPEFDHVVIGTGESRAVAASRALAHMRDLNIRPIREGIEAQTQVVLTPQCNEVEADCHGMQMYCIIAISVERQV